MIAAIRIHLVAFLATVLGTLTASPIWAAPEIPKPIYTYTALADSAPRDGDALERGPPAARDRFTNRDVANRRFGGALARPHKATPSEATTYDHPAPLAQVAHAPAAVRGHVGDFDGDLAALSGGAVAAKTTARACSFTGTTVVLMADGTKKPIEDIEVGDKVMATDPETGEQVAKRVEHVFVHGDRVVDLVVDGEVIATTEDNPFWSVTDQRFERADELADGEQVLGADGRVVTVSGLQLGTERHALAYNLAVEGIHTYHVGRRGIVVHNDCSDEALDIASKSFGDHGAAMGFRNADERGSYLDDIMQGSAGHLRDDGSRFWIDYGRSAIVFRGPNPGVPGTVYRPDNFARAVQRELDRTVME